MNEDVAYAEWSQPPLHWIEQMEQEAYERWAEDRRDDALDDSPEAYAEWTQRDTDFVC